MSQPQEQKVSLGCGTLILIAIIVLVFSGRSNYDKIEDKIDSLTREVSELKAEVSAMRLEQKQ